MLAIRRSFAGSVIVSEPAASTGTACAASAPAGAWPVRAGSMLMNGPT